MDTESVINPCDENGNPLPEFTIAAMRHAYHLLYNLPDDIRARILCWFCPLCAKFIAPGKAVGPGVYCIECSDKDAKGKSQPEPVPMIINCPTCRERPIW